MKLKLKERHKAARIEIIPLIDIMFFLLATFVMVSTAMIKNRGIPVHLPSATTGTQEDRKDYVALTISESGEYFLDKERIEKSQLGEKLLAFKAATPDPKVFLNGDSRASLELLVAALDAVRGAGITKIALETKAKE